MRYLTPDAKTSVLGEWQHRIDNAPRTDLTEGCLGGHGGVDAPMIDQCAQINALPGVVTLQSCTGHVRQSDLGQYVLPGQLWLWFDEATARVVYETITDLPAWYEQPRLMWQASGQEVLDLRWSPTRRAEDACGALIDWLGAICEAAR